MELFLSHEKYIVDISKRVGIKDCKLVTTPLPTSEKMTLSEGEPLGGEDSTRYRSLMGAL